MEIGKDRTDAVINDEVRKDGMGVAYSGLGIFDLVVGDGKTVIYREDRSVFLNIPAELPEAAVMDILKVMYREYSLGYDSGKKETFNKMKAALDL